MRTYTFAIVGCGKLAQIVVEALLNKLLPSYKLIGCYSRTFKSAQEIANKINASTIDDSCKPCENIEELLLLKPDYIVETASPSAFKELDSTHKCNISLIIDSCCKNFIRR